MPLQLVAEVSGDQGRFRGQPNRRSVRETGLSHLRWQVSLAWLRSTTTPTALRPGASPHS